MTNVLHVNATVSCPHGGRASYLPASPRVNLSGRPAATMAGTWLIAGCLFTVGTKPQPCVTIRWVTPAARVTVGGAPVVTQASTGLCLSAEQVPQGPLLVTVVQQRTKGV
ncbi:hypothetical protein [Streptomyces paludis]|uniref:DUF4280 domain-containing protein n=1 Tax=Streptomyces paludis TaxID=2282738 RepID=A0A345HYX0_9ACTN|nr:hypothetical protein [Streptomyces paludis]AXG81894.1 hypothetical protein DVK44_33870 [Streptomyces paludis]